MLVDERKQVRVLLHPAGVENRCWQFGTTEMPGV